MKLLFFATSMDCGGAERATATLANYWAQKGWDISIVTLAPLSADAYELHPAIRRMEINIAGPSGNMMLAVLRNIKRAKALRRELLSHKPDVAVAIMGPNNFVTLALAAQGAASCVAIGSLHSHPPALPTKLVWKVIERRAYRFLSAIVALTSRTSDWCIANTNARRMELIPNPVSWPLPSSGRYLEPSAFCGRNRRVLLSAGRLAPEKRLDLLITAFCDLAGSFPDWDLVIIGEGPERRSLQQQISARGMESRIFLPGWAGNLGDWYNRAELFVMTSQFEGFGNSLAEAMAHGLPAVSFDCDTGPREIIRPHQDGLLVPPGDVGALTGALKRLMSNANLRERFGIAAKEARNRFSIEVIANKWEHLFAELLNAKSGSEPEQC